MKIALMQISILRIKHPISNIKIISYNRSSIATFSKSVCPHVHTYMSMLTNQKNAGWSRGPTMTWPGVIQYKKKWLVYATATQLNRWSILASSDVIYPLPGPDQRPMWRCTEEEHGFFLWTFKCRFQRKGDVGYVLSPGRKSGTARFTRATCFAYR